MNRDDNGEIYLEIVPLETGLRITAIDAATGTEVVFAAPKNVARREINKLAAAKLRRRIALDAGRLKPGTVAKGQQAAPQARERGRLV
ncbi:MAG: serine hydroxymethyltransferase [Pseudomonadota bacterium]